MPWCYGHLNLVDISKTSYRADIIFLKSLVVLRMYVQYNTIIVYDCREIVLNYAYAAIVHVSKTKKFLDYVVNDEEMRKIYIY